MCLIFFFQQFEFPLLARRSILKRFNVMFLRFKQLDFSNLTPWAQFLNSQRGDSNCSLGCFLSYSRPVQSTERTAKAAVNVLFLIRAESKCKSLVSNPHLHVVMSEADLLSNLIADSVLCFPPTLKEPIWPPRSDAVFTFKVT